MGGGRDFNRSRETSCKVVEVCPPRLRSRKVAAGRPARADVMHHRHAGASSADCEIMIADFLPIGQMIFRDEHRGTELAVSTILRRHGTPAAEPRPGCILALGATHS